MRYFCISILNLILLHGMIPWAAASEVIPLTKTKVLVRNHEKTGQPYVSIVSSDISVESESKPDTKKKISRPDYRMLDPKVKDGEIPYDGPYSSSTKVYVFAASLATLGVVGGTVLAAAAPAAAGASTAGGGGAFAAGGAAVATGTLGTVSMKMKLDPQDEEFQVTSESQSLEQGGRRLSFHEIVAEYDVKADE